MNRGKYGLLVGALGLGWAVVAALAASDPARYILMGIGLVLAVGYVGFWANYPIRWLAFSLCLYAIAQNVLEQYSLHVVGLKANLAQVLGFAILGLLVVRMLQPGLALPTRFVWPGLIFLGSLLLALLRTRHVDIGIPALLRTVTVFGAFYYVLVFARHVEHYRVLRAAVIFSSLLASVALLADFLMGRTPLLGISVGPQRAEGLFGRPNISADVAMLAVPALLAFLHDSERRRTYWRIWLSVAGIVICSLGLFASFTRSNILAVLLFVVFYLRDQKLFSGRMAQFNRVLVVLLIGVSVPMAIHLVGEGAVAARLSDIPVIGGRTVTDPTVGSGRVMIWSSLLSRIGDGGLIGLVIGSGLWVTLDITKESIFLARAAHNSYIELLWNQGLIGLGAYVWFYAVILRALRLVGRGSSELAADARIWRYMVIAFMLTGEMFTTTCYSLASRWYLYVVSAGVIGIVVQNRARTGGGIG